MRLLIVSPHRDDACFSLALALLQWQREMHRTYIVNCFTRSEYAPHSDADETHRNDRTDYVSALRKREDERFFRRAGVSGTDDLDLKDAPIRFRCGVAEVCSGSLSPDETTLDRLRDRVRAIIAARRPDMLLLPLALGRHVDHVTTRDALLTLADDVSCAFYEDLPYASHPGVMDRIESVAAEVGGKIGQQLNPLLLGGPGDVTEKRALAALYASQIDATEAWGLANFALHYGGCERVWATRAFKDALAQQPEADSPGFSSAAESRSA